MNHCLKKRPSQLQFVKNIRVVDLSIKMVLKVLLLCVLLGANSVSDAQSNGYQESTIAQEPFLIGYVQKLQTYVWNVHVPPEEGSGNLGALAAVNNLGIGDPPYMVADLTGERLCFGQTSKLTCIERQDSGKVEERMYATPPHIRIILVNFPRPQTNDYEVVYTTRKYYKREWTVLIKMFDSNSNSSVTIYEGQNIYEENTAVDINNWFVFFEDVKHDKFWYVDLIRGFEASPIPQYTKNTTEGNHRINTIAVDIKAGVLYNMVPAAVFSWRYLNETIPKFNFWVHENDQKSHLSLSADDKLFYTRQINRTNFSLVSQTKTDWKQYVPKQQGNSKLFFGTAIFRNQNKTNLGTSCPRFCRLNGNGNCICWCPNEKPLLTLNMECEPVVILAIQGSGKSGKKIFTTSSEPNTDWDWMTKYNFGEGTFAYNAVENRLCGPKLNTETKKTGLWCYYAKPEKGHWIPEDATSEKGGANVLYPVNQAANTSDIYWMAEAENETQSLWALENGIAKSMKVYVKDPKHVAVDSFRQILFWCTEINATVQLRWQAFNQTGKKPDCFQRQVFGATKCNGLAVSEVQTKVFVHSQDTIYQSTYEELHTERDIRNHIFKFEFVQTINGFSYHSGNLIWSPSGLVSGVAVFQIPYATDIVVRKPTRVIPIDEWVTQIQVLMPHSEVVKTVDQCIGFSVNFAGICSGHVSESGFDPPATCAPELHPGAPTDSTEATIPASSATEINPVSSKEPEAFLRWPYLACVVIFTTVILTVLNALACRRIKNRLDYNVQHYQKNPAFGNEALAQESQPLEAQIEPLDLPLRAFIHPTSIQIPATQIHENNVGDFSRANDNGRLNQESNSLAKCLLTLEPTAESTTLTIPTTTL